MNVVKEEPGRKANGGRWPGEVEANFINAKEKKITDLLLISLESNSEFHGNLPMKRCRKMREVSIN